MTTPANITYHETAARPVLLRRPDAAEALGMSVDTFERYVEARLKRVYVGRLRLIPFSELERFANEEAV